MLAGQQPVSRASCFARQKSNLFFGDSSYSPTRLPAGSLKIANALPYVFHRSRYLTDRIEKEASGAKHRVLSLEVRTNHCHRVSELVRRVLAKTPACWREQQLSGSGDSAADDDPIRRENRRE